ncbi:hypothetical protein HY086_02070 [Candidatus Gottesmanbacteria bacterium]|nr:hypothetical protein [Candidatus Gottesmanbacteria bacterium]
MKISFLIVLSLAIFAARALFTPGFLPTHDGEYHLIRFHEFSTMLSAGYFFPRWAPNLNSGYGMPLFNFHYPFPNYLGSLYHFLGVSYPDAVKLVLATGYLVAVIFCYFWLVKLFDKKTAVFGTVVFSFIPYWFVDMYVRGVVGEVFGIAWVMLALASIERGWKTFLTISVGLLIISHNIMSLLFLPFLLAYILIRNRSMVTSLLLGIGLSSYFWIPAILEQQYVVGLNTVNFRDHFPDFAQLLVPSWGTGFSQAGQPADEMSFQIGIAPLLIFMSTPFLLLRKDKKGENNKQRKRLAIFFLLVSSAAFILMLEPSRPVWEQLPFLSYLQYPWRLLSVFLPATAFLSAYVLVRGPGWIGIVFTLVAISLSLSYTVPVVYTPRSDAYYLSRPNFTDGTSSLGNAFSTVWTGWKQTRPKQKVEVVEGNTTIGQILGKPLGYNFLVETPASAVLRANTLYYPGWNVTANGVPLPIEYKKDGSITFSIGPGKSNIRVFFEETPLRKTADAASLVSLFWLIASVILKFYAHRYRHDITGHGT